MLSPILTIIPASSFVWNGSTKGVAEASDLGSYDFTRPVYDDACDIGFVAASATGRKLLFTLVKELRDPREGELVGWEFTCNGELVFGRVRPIVQRYDIVIFND